MADVRPFRGIRYDEEKAGSLSLNVCPTYDLISRAEQEQFSRRTPYNVIRLELAFDWGADGRSDTRYERAAETQARWLRAGILRRDEAPSMYVLEERFEFRGARYRRLGLLAAVRLEEYSRGVVMPHEHTRPGPIADRLALMKAARSNFSPLMMLFREGPDASLATNFMEMARRPPDIVAEPPSLPAMRIWQISDPDRIQAISAALRDRQLFIADGHHRYEAALAYRNAVRSRGAAHPDDAVNFRIAVLFALDDPGLFLLGYHRVAQTANEAELEALRARIRDLCHLRAWTPPEKEPGYWLERELARADDAAAVFGVAGLEPGALHVATLKTRAPQTSQREASEYARLHREVFAPVFGPARENSVISFRHDSDIALADVAQGRCQMAFVMRAVAPELFEAVVSKGERLPPKSTLFHPKLSAGVVMQTLDGGL